MKKSIEIIKASGQKEKFSKEKLRLSLKRAGVESSLAEEVSGELAKTVYPSMTSEKILSQVLGRLKKKNRFSASRYSLKRAIMELGPTGFPFEGYVAEIIKAYGYDVKVGRAVKGRCISHEVDIVAGKGKERFMVECKYHNSRGAKSDAKVVMHTYARFLDIKNNQPHFSRAWLATNTRCTSEAIRYAKCVGLKIISWHYPKKASLERLIEEKGLYPITILPSLTRQAREKLAGARIMLARDLAGYPFNHLIRRTGLNKHIIKKLQAEARELWRRQI